MKKTFCDRCGKDISEERGWRITLYLTTSNSIALDESFEVDLCEECNCELKEFLRKNK